MECKLIFSKATNKYILALPVNFNPDAKNSENDCYLGIQYQDDNSEKIM